MNISLPTLTLRFYPVPILLLRTDFFLLDSIFAPIFDSEFTLLVTCDFVVLWEGSGRMLFYFSFGLGPLFESNGLFIPYGILVTLNGSSWFSCFYGISGLSIFETYELAWLSIYLLLNNDFLGSVPKLVTGVSNSDDRLTWSYWILF
jgi:hypothetical protein